MRPGATRPGAAFILGYNTYSTYELYRTHPLEDFNTTLCT